MLKKLTPQDKAVFSFDIMDVPIVDYSVLFGYGINKWIIKAENLDVPVDLSGHDLNTKITIDFL